MRLRWLRRAQEGCVVSNAALRRWQWFGLLWSVVSMVANGAFLLFRPALTSSWDLLFFLSSTAMAIYFVDGLCKPVRQ